MSDDTPTERFSSSQPAGAAPQDVTAGAQSPQKSSRAMLYALIAVGAALLIAIFIVLLLLTNRGEESSDLGIGPSATESASPTPTITMEASPSATPTPAEPAPPVAPPPPDGPTFDSFTYPASAGCNPGDGDVPLSFSWSSSNATTAYIGVMTNNAKAGPWESNLPVVYTYTGISYNCGQPSQYYTVTLEDGDGRLTHKTVTITP